MLLVDTKEGRIISDEEVKARIARSILTGNGSTSIWLVLEDLPDAPELPEPDHETVNSANKRLAIHLKTYVKCLSRWPEAALSRSAPWVRCAACCLVERPQLLYNYFKQIFAQVTNPPIDAIREEIITATGTTIGPERNLLNPEPESCRHIRLASPFYRMKSSRSCVICIVPASSPSRFRFCSKRQRAKRELRAAIKQTV